MNHSAKKTLLGEGATPVQQTCLNQIIFKTCHVILQYHPSLAALSLFIQIKRGYKHKSGVNLAGIYHKWDKNRPAGIEFCYKWDTVIPLRSKVSTSGVAIILGEDEIYFVIITDDDSYLLGFSTLGTMLPKNWRGNFLLS